MNGQLRDALKQSETAPPDQQAKLLAQCRLLEAKFNQLTAQYAVLEAAATQPSEDKEEEAGTAPAASRPATRPAAIRAATRPAATRPAGT